jgi:hypothetical protein
VRVPLPLANQTCAWLQGNISAWEARSVSMGEYAKAFARSRTEAAFGRFLKLVGEHRRDEFPPYPKRWRPAVELDSERFQRRGAEPGEIP